MLADAARRGRVAVVDYAGHPFQVELSRSLAANGYEVLHLYCPDVATGTGKLDNDPIALPLLAIEPVSRGHAVERYRFAQRAVQERSWGSLAARRLRSWKPDVVLLSNVPLLAQAVLVPRCRRLGMGVVLWQQDVHARAAADVLAGKFGPVGPWIAGAFHVIERSCARRCDAVITISSEFCPILLSWGINPDKITVQSNWAPLNEIMPTLKDNHWSRQHALVGRPVVLYAGTLSFKHNPQQLLDIARALRGRADGAMVVVTSEGLGREFLQTALVADPTLPLKLLDFQPYEQLANMLGAADVLVAILEAAAGSFSVPSKIFSYLCSGRPIVASIPEQNQAAAVLEESGAAVVVKPDDSGGVTRAVEQLLGDPVSASRAGEFGRRYAEASFDVNKIWPRFADVVDRVNPSGRTL